jgi:tryptophanyl-tRNA synthetase
MKQTLKNMVTDPARKRRSDPGNPDVCPLGDYHKVFSDENRIAEVDQGCRSAGIGCIECKMWLFESLQKKVAPIYERRQALEARKDDVVGILKNGAAKAKIVAQATMALVREAVKI